MQSILKKLKSLFELSKFLGSFNEAISISFQLISAKEIISFKYKNEIFYTNNDKGTIYHILNSLNKLEQMVSSIKKESKIIFDIGANNGLFSKLVKMKIPDSKIYLFEADKELIKVIQLNMSNYSNINIINKAVSDTDGVVKFYINKYSKQMNSTEKEAAEVLNKDIDEVIIESITLDSFVRAENISSIDILKVDIQGGETKMINGADNAMQIVENAFFEITFLDKDVVKLLIKLKQYFSNNYQVINPVYMGVDLLFSKKKYET